MNDLASVEFLVKLRDAALMMADAAGQYLEAMAPADKEKKHYDINRIKWVEAQGSRGPYEKSEDVGSADFKALTEDLEVHGGKLSHAGYFIWKFSNSTVIGRKKRS